MPSHSIEVRIMAIHLHPTEQAMFLLQLARLKGELVPSVYERLVIRRELEGAGMHADVYIGQHAAPVSIPLTDSEYKLCLWYSRQRP
jgi:hypothetical protein